MAGDLLARRAEFERNLWDHAVDEFQAQFDERRELSDGEVEFLTKVHEWIATPGEDLALSRLKAALGKDKEQVALLLQICGLTRTKILTDLRASAAAKKLKIPSDYRNIAVTDGWKLAGPYLLKRLRATLGQFDPHRPTLSALFQSLNQATWPGYIRQQRAKLSGHAAEYRLAVLFASLEIPFVPAEKSENPLCRDAQLDGMSFDLVVPTLAAPQILIMCTVHTANIGQYGESKTSGDVATVRRWIDKMFRRQSKPTLMAFADGVGFPSNRAGLDGVLVQSDEFCQFRSMWKAVVIAAKRLNEPLRVALPSALIKEFAGFIDRWDARDMVDDLNGLASTVGWLDAGDGLATRTD